MSEDMLLAAMDTDALFGIGRRARLASWAGAAAAVTAVFATLGALFA